MFIGFYGLLGLNMEVIFRFGKFLKIGRNGRWGFLFLIGLWGYVCFLVDKFWLRVRKIVFFVNY